MGCSREASVIGCFIAPALRLFKVQDFQKPRVSIKNMTRQHDEHNTIFFSLAVYFNKAHDHTGNDSDKVSQPATSVAMYQVQST